MIRAITMYQVVCEQCERVQGEDEEICAWSDADSAIAVALESDWHIAEDGRELCWDCWPEDEEPEADGR